MVWKRDSRFSRGNAFKLPFAAETFDIVINEAMLTMFPDVSKQKALAEYYRVLKPGGKLLTHDVSLIKEDLELVAKLGQTINGHITQLTRRKWEELFKQQGFLVSWTDESDGSTWNDQRRRGAGSVKNHKKWFKTGKSSPVSGNVQVV